MSDGGKAVRDTLLGKGYNVCNLPRCEIWAQEQLLRERSQTMARWQENENRMRAAERRPVASAGYCVRYKSGVDGNSPGLSRKEHRAPCGVRFFNHLAVPENIMEWEIASEGLLSKTLADNPTLPGGSKVKCTSTNEKRHSFFSGFKTRKQWWVVSLKDNVGTRIFARWLRDADHGFDKYYLPAYRYMVQELRDGQVRIETAAQHAVTCSVCSAAL